LSWSLPEAGLLELDYATFRLRYEETYALDLARAPERAILSKLVERAAVERSNERFVDATLDALPIRLPDSAASAARWTMPPTGLLRASFVSATPQHVSTKHYALDLAVRDEWRLAERLRQWAVSEPGENFLNETLDGFPFTFNESDAAAAAGGGGSVGPQIDVRYSLLARAAGPGLRAREKRRNLPKAGLLEFDYVTLRPRTTIAVESRTFRLDLSRPEDVRIARTLRSLGADMGGKNWVDESVDGHALRVIVRRRGCTDAHTLRASQRAPCARTIRPRRPFASCRAARALRPAAAPAHTPSRASAAVLPAALPAAPG
jgi:hypothetical protein